MCDFMFLVFVKRLALYFAWNLSGFSKSILLYSPVTFWERCKEGSYEIQGYLKLKDAILKWSFYHKASLFFIFITLAFFIHTLQNRLIGIPIAQIIIIIIWTMENVNNWLFIDCGWLAYIVKLWVTLQFMLARCF